MEITWTIAQLDRRPEDGFVTNAHWRVEAQEDNEFFASSYGECVWESGELITPYVNLSEEQVLGWVWQKINKQQVEDYLRSQIDAQKTPPRISGVPW